MDRQFLTISFTNNLEAFFCSGIRKMKNGGRLI